MASNNQVEGIKKGKTVYRYEIGKHRVDMFGHYEKEYNDTGKVPEGFHI